MNEDIVQLVWKVLSGIPIDVFDDESGEIWEGSLWELVVPRSAGDYAGSREIGSANLISAYNLLYLKIIMNSSAAETLERFKTVLETLESRKLIRKRPDKVRQTFKVV